MRTGSELLILAADGGGVKTDVALTDGDGKVLAAEVFGPTNPNRAEGLHPEGLLWEAADVLRAKADISKRQIDVAVFGLAGVDDAEQAASLRIAFRNRELATTVFVGNDAMLPLGMLAGRVGVAVVAGTGSIGVGRNSKGDMLRAGGNGPNFDPGSGQEIGQMALYDAARFSDGRLDGTPTSDFFTEHVFNAAQRGVTAVLEKGVLVDPEVRGTAQAFVDRKLKLGIGMAALYESLHQLGNPTMAAVQNSVTPELLWMASLAETDGRTILRPAIPEARAIADICAKRLSEHVKALGRRLDMPEFPLAVTGSTLVQSEYYRSRFLHEVSQIPDITISGDPVIVERPINGAIKLGVELGKTIYGS